MTVQAFTPAAGRFTPTRFYDRGLALLTREEVWRSKILKLLAPANDENILDVGCGTGSLAILIKRAAPGAHVVGIDPDTQALSIARRKAEDAGVEIEWRCGFARDVSSMGVFDKVVSSLVFHQVPVEEKRIGMAAMFTAMRPGGVICIADYARQSSWIMRQAFRFIQLIDGRLNTEPNARGFSETELALLFGRDVKAASPVDTPTGTISIFHEDCMAR